MRPKKYRFVDSACRGERLRILNNPHHFTNHEMNSQSALCLERYAWFPVLAELPLRPKTGSNPTAMVVGETAGRWVLVPDSAHILVFAASLVLSASAKLFFQK